MNVRWLIEEGAFEESLEPLISEITRQGMVVKTAKYIPLDGEAAFFSLFEPEECVVFYGSLQMARRAQRQTKWIPGVYCNLPKFECTYYYPRFGNLLLNSNYVMLPYGELLRRKEFLFDTLGKTGRVFVRPSSGFKIFTGKAVSFEEWEKSVELFSFYDVEPERIVVVAESKDITAEWRLIVVDNHIVCGSQYHDSLGMKLSENVPQRVIDFGQKVIEQVDYQPDPAWVLDVCQTNQGLHVLEVGCFSSAGFYLADKESIVRGVSQVAFREWEDYNKI